jgi:hypothetical protein
MAIFPARRIGILPPKQALSAATALASRQHAIAFAGAGSTAYRIFSIGPNFETPPARVAVEEIAGRWTERQHRVLQAEPGVRLPSSAANRALRAFEPIRSKKKT